MFSRGFQIMTALVALLFAAACRRSDTVREVSAQASASVPDFSGIWEPAQGEFKPGTQRIERPKAEFTPEYLEKHLLLRKIYSHAEIGAVKQYNARDYVIVRRMVGECVPYGMPQMMADDGDGASETMDIAQTKNSIIIVGEGGLGPQVRHIYLDREQLPIKDVEPTYTGRSVGKWEGNVLVVNTVGVKKELEGQDLMPHSDQMVITERLQLKDALLIVDLTITDPLALKKPWMYSAKFRRAAKDFEPTEGYCENSNHYQFDENGKLVVK
jgi:hypothetical protein